MPEVPPPIPADRCVVAWSRVNNYLDRLFDALQALEESGSSTRVAAFQGWKPQTHAKAVASLKATRDAIDAELARLAARNRHFPRRLG